MRGPDDVTGVVVAGHLTQLTIAKATIETAERSVQEPQSFPRNAPNERTKVRTKRTNELQMESLPRSLRSPLTPVRRTDDKIRSSFFFRDGRDRLSAAEIQLTGFVRTYSLKGGEGEPRRGREEKVNKSSRAFVEFTG